MLIDDDRPFEVICLVSPLMRAQFVSAGVEQPEPHLAHPVPRLAYPEIGHAVHIACVRADDGGTCLAPVFGLRCLLLSTEPVGACVLLAYGSVDGEGIRLRKRRPHLEYERILRESLRRPPSELRLVAEERIWEGMLQLVVVDVVYLYVCLLKVTHQETTIMLKRLLIFYHPNAKKPS